MVQIEKDTKILVYLGSENEKHLRGSTQAKISPLADSGPMGLGLLY